MKVNEIEKTLGVTRANIRFYEKEGLLHPPRTENNYREYRVEELVRLKQIVILRRIGVPIPRIRELIEGESELSEVMEENEKLLLAQLESLNGALELTRKIQSQPQPWSQFDTDFYWEAIHNLEKHGRRFVDVCHDVLQDEQEMLQRTWFLDALLKERKQGLKWVIGVALAVSVGSGLMGQFVWDSGFLWGFFYPWIVLAIAAIILFPVAVVRQKSRKWADRILEAIGVVGAAVIALAVLMLLAGVICHLAGVW